MNIGLAISGGDGSGINNFIHSFCSYLDDDNNFYFFQNGLNGLLKNDVEIKSKYYALDYSLSDLPCISSGRTSKILDDNDRKIILENLKKNNIDIFVLAGGDGSLHFLNTLKDEHIKFYGIPLTIDNDIEGSDYSIGHPTAIEVVKDEVKRIRNSGRALNNRVFILEVLGGYCGYLALNSALISNADFVLVPELPIDLDKVANSIKEKLKKQNSFVIICSEGCKPSYKPGDQVIAPEFARILEEKTGIRVRQGILGYGQRNGIPNTEELYKSNKLAYYLKCAIDEGIHNVFVGLTNDCKASYIKLGDIKTRKIDKEHENVKMAMKRNII